MNDEAVRDHLQADLDREDGREEVVKVVQNLQHVVVNVAQSSLPPSRRVAREIR